MPKDDEMHTNKVLRWLELRKLTDRWCQLNLNEERAVSAIWWNFNAVGYALKSMDSRANKYNEP